MTTSTHGTAGTPNQEGKFIHALSWYGAGLALFGATVGYLVGASQSPVVATVIPLLFGLATGAGGFYLAKADLSKELTRQKLQVFGKTTIVFLVLLLFGASVGIASRTGIGLSSLFSNLWSGTEETAIAADKIPPLDTIRLVMLRENLKAIGATAQEQQLILAIAAPIAAPVFDKDQTSSTLDEIAKLAALVRDGITPISRPSTSANEQSAVATEESEETADAVNSMQFVAAVLAQEAGYFARQLKAGTRNIPSNVLVERIGSHEDRITSLLQSEHLSRWLTQQVSLGDAAYDLRLSLSGFKQQLGALTYSIADQANSQIGTFLLSRSDLIKDGGSSPLGAYFASNN